VRIDTYYLRVHADNETGVAGSASAVHRPVPPDEQLALAAETFRMLADPTRVAILWELTGGERSVTEIAAAVHRPAAATSQHLARLRLGGAVVARRQGTTMLYSIASDHVARLALDAVHNAEHHEGGVPAHHRTDPGLVALPTAAEGAR
jgi:DNA-binding transcriptional ArsR family regulator